MTNSPPPAFDAHGADSEAAVNWAKSVLNVTHGWVIFGRRVRVRARALADQLGPGASVLDVGCGDGSIALEIMRLRPDVRIVGIDVFERRNAKISTTVFDGREIPFPRKAFDQVMFVDVLHHTNDPDVLVGEAVRVARSGLVIKDHLCEGLLAGPTLRLMDWVGNSGHNVNLPYNYLRLSDWTLLSGRNRLRTSGWTENLALYPPPLSWVFGRRLHFVAQLTIG